MKYFDSNGETHSSIFGSYISDLKSFVRGQKRNVDNIQTDSHPKNGRVIDDLNTEVQAILVEEAIHSMTEEEFIEKVLTGAHVDLGKLTEMQETFQYNPNILEDETTLSMVENILALSSTTISKALDENPDMFKNEESQVIRKILTGVLDIVKENK